MALFLLKTGTCEAKTELVGDSVDPIFCFVTPRFLSKKRDKYKVGLISQQFFYLGLHLAQSCYS